MTESDCVRLTPPAVRFQNRLCRETGSAGPGIRPPYSAFSAVQDIRLPRLRIPDSLAPMSARHGDSIGPRDVERLTVAPDSEVAGPFHLPPRTDRRHQGRLTGT
jgi:hypothetical protein